MAARRTTLLARTTIADGPHAQLRIPLATANSLLATLVHDEHFTVPLELPSLGPITLPVHREIRASARDVELRPAPAGRLQFAIRLDIGDEDRPLTTIAIVAETTPEIVRTPEAIDLIIGFRAENLVDITPDLDPNAGEVLVDHLLGWLPRVIRENLPRATVDRAAQKLREFLTGKAFQLLRKTLLPHLGELTKLRLSIPALPIAKIALGPTTDALTIDLTMDLPGVRRGITTVAPPSSDVMFRVSGSTAAELINWGIDKAWLPQHYTRGLDPSPTGQYRPRFDFLVDDVRRPVKIHVFQETGGCSYFGVGMIVEVALDADRLRIATLDQFVESVDASPQLELALWFKQMIAGSDDSTRRAATRTRFSIGNRGVEARVVRATLAGGELALGLELVPEPEHPPAP